MELKGGFFIEGRSEQGAPVDQDRLFGFSEFPLLGIPLFMCRNPRQFKAPCNGARMAHTSLQSRFP
jgi:hypothetical protein